MARRATKHTNRAGEEYRERERGGEAEQDRQLDSVFFLAFFPEENKKFPCLKALNIQFRYLKMFSTTTATAEGGGGGGRQREDS